MSILHLNIYTYPRFEFHRIVIIVNGNFFQPASYKCFIKFGEFCLWILCNEIMQFGDPLDMFVSGDTINFGLMF